MSLGPIMMDLRGSTLAADEREWLQHPLIGGVVLFARNYLSPRQITSLVQNIKAVRNPALLIAVDHEGGRIQRFKDQFTSLPSAQALGTYYERDHRQGLAMAERIGWLMAAELRAVGVDFSFAPVVDIDHGISHVIGDRAFHKHARHVASLAKAYIHGMHAAGMAAVAKHFPGHGGISEDSHFDVAEDKRRYADIEAEDMLPFARLIDTAGLPAIMPAHVVYPDVDDKPAGFSSVWLQTILRQTLKFKGVVFSDDLSMAAAEIVGCYIDRARCALAAGCDMILICNNQAAVVTLLDQLDVCPDPALSERLTKMHGKNTYDFSCLQDNKNWQVAKEAITRLTLSP